MPRGPRLDYPGALHHVMARGIERRAIFLDDRDRDQFLQRLRRVVGETALEIYAWSLLPNHFHLLVRTRASPLSSAMRRLQTGHAVAFNRRHRRCGHLFQNRFKSVLVEEEPYLLELVRYIHLNPVRCRLVASIDELDHYTWSGHAALLGHAQHDWQSRDAVLALFGRRVGRARRAYRDFVKAGWEQGHCPELAGGGLVRHPGEWRIADRLPRGRERWSADERILGSRQFLERVRAAATLPQTQPLHQPMGWEDLVRVVAERSAISPIELTGGGRRRPVAAARTVLSHLAVHYLALSLTAAAARMQVSKQTVLHGVRNGARIMQERRWSFDQVIRPAAR